MLKRIPKKPVPDMIRDQNRFSEKMRVKTKNESDVSVQSDRESL